MGYVMPVALWNTHSWKIQMTSEDIEASGNTLALSQDGKLLALADYS
jgi:hypothetical protein